MTDGRRPTRAAGERRFAASLAFTVRSCLADDLPALEWFGMFRHHRQIISRTFAQAAQGQQLMWVADVRGFPAGQIWIDLRSDRAWAARVFPFLQGCGIGGHLADVAEQDLAARGRARVSVAVETTNIEAMRFWLARGYRSAGRVAEPWSYDTPDGAHVDVSSDLYLLAKDL